ncbi:hypothetical protein GWK47_052762 [Chionoecetes opilio]|uniref:CCHC-type domain-containing protein n=1 Tax=Chionoecetes opilio TaxID=41210 RepID=A0A8J4XZQ1_CHIOP|nr:hypothetical protein GWK47_052762 [Chionoecetes opilio]
MPKLRKRFFVIRRTLLPTPLRIPSSGHQAHSHVTCHHCGEAGHIRPHCPHNPRTFKDGTTAAGPYKVRFCLEDRKVPQYSVSGTINCSWSSTIIRDTGCSGVVVSEDALPDIDPSLCPKVKVADYLGRTNDFPVVRCYLRCPFYTGWTDAVRAPLKVASALIGNIPGVLVPNGPDSQLRDDHFLSHLATVLPMVACDDCCRKQRLPGSTSSS